VLKSDTVCRNAVCSAMPHPLVCNAGEIKLTSFIEQHGEDVMAKKDQRSKKAKKLARKVKKEAKKEKKTLNTEVNRSDVKPPSPFSS
jgi:hypothetical protein